MEAMACSLVVLMMSLLAALKQEATVVEVVVVLWLAAPMTLVPMSEPSLPGSLMNWERPSVLLLHLRE